MSSARRTTRGNAIGYRARPNGDDADTCIYEAFAVEQIRVAHYDNEVGLEPEFYADWTEQEMTIYNHHRVADRYLWRD